MMKENSKNVMTYLQANTDNAQMTSDVIANATQIPKKSVVGIVNALVRKQLVAYTDAEIEVEEGKHKAVKFISLTDAGKTFDVNAPDEVK